MEQFQIFGVEPVIFRKLPEIVNRYLASYSDEPPFKILAVSAIAGVLIRDWVDGQIGFPQESPRFGAGADKQLTKETSLEFSLEFWLNKYFNKELLYALK